MITLFMYCGTTFDGFQVRLTSHKLDCTRALRNDTARPVVYSNRRLFSKPATSSMFKTEKSLKCTCDSTPYTERDIPKVKARKRAPKQR